MANDESNASERPAPDAPRAGFWSRLDRWLERAGERLNPILVKEARQALKSRQFISTFTLLLLCGWGWSLMGVAMMSPEIHYAPSGPSMLVGYCFVLAVPLLLIVPFVTYRSLASEREDGTYELLSITALSSRQIVSGKMGSAVLQMMVYYSALSPCIAFTYLLRGVDVLTILLFLLYTFLASVILSLASLVVATMTHLRHLQMLLSVLLLLGLAFVTLVWCVWSAQVVSMGWFPYDDPDFWVAQLSLLSGYVSYCILFLFAAAAQLSFASDNRSTRLRVIMLGQQILLVAWMMYYWLTEGEEGVLYALVAVSGFHWMVMGALMTGEWGVLSPRVKRRLPQSLLGRALLTWFNPGPGTGYVFAVVNFGAVVLVAWTANAIGGIVGFRGADSGLGLYLFGGLACAYLAAYLGVGRLLVLLVRRKLQFGLLMPLIVHGILVVLGAAVPAFLQAWLFGFDGLDDYTVFQATNWPWTLGLAADVDPQLMSALGAPVFVVFAAVAIFVVNLIAAAREVEQVRQETPARVLEDDLERHPELVAQTSPRSPFDD